MEPDSSHSPLSSNLWKLGSRVVNSGQTCTSLVSGLEFGRLSLSQWTPLVHVELDRKQFFSIELDFK